MKKYFKSNKDYFTFYNMKKDKIKIKEIKFVKSKLNSIIKFKYCLIYDAIV